MIVPAVGEYQTTPNLSGLGDDWGYDYGAEQSPEWIPPEGPAPAQIGPLTLEGDFYADTSAGAYDASVPPIPIVYSNGSTAPTHTGTNWSLFSAALVRNGFDLSKQIIATQPGTFTQQTPSGTITYRQPTGSTALVPFAAGSLQVSPGSLLTGAGGMAILAGVGIFLVMMMSGGRRR